MVRLDFVLAAQRYLLLLDHFLQVDRIRQRHFLSLYFFKLVLGGKHILNFNFSARRIKTDDLGQSLVSPSFGLRCRGS